MRKGFLPQQAFNGMLAQISFAFRTLKASLGALNRIAQIAL
jgi:hypothetical protein